MEGEKSCSEFEIKNLDRGLSLKEQLIEKKVIFIFKFLEIDFNLGKTNKQFPKFLRRRFFIKELEV